MDTKEDTYPEGHFISMWMGIGIAIFSGFGIPLAIATGHSWLIGIGPALGVGFGLSIGEIIENKYKKEGKIRSLSEDEIKKKNIAVKFGILILTIGVLFALFLYIK